MSFVLGRESGLEDGPSGLLGTYRAIDGSDGAPVHLDLDHPHAGLIVGKRGYGKSYTLGVVAEALARSDGTAPVVIDPMGEFATLSAAGDESISATVVGSPSVTPSTLDPQSWCALLGLAPDSGVGTLVWQAAGEADTIAGMCETIRSMDAPRVDERAACNHLDMADRWGVFDLEGLTAGHLAADEITVLDVSGLGSAPMNAVVRGVCDTLYRARIEQRIERLPWLLVDEAHTFFGSVAGPALRRLLTRGRSPGVSLVLATQRPSAVPAVAISQSDLLVAHRLTAESDCDALAAAQPTYLTTGLREQLPTAPGEVLVVDDTTETVHTATVRERLTPHAGASPRASDVRTDD